MKTYNKDFFMNKFYRIIFSKRILFIIVMLLQILIMGLLYWRFKDGYKYLHWVFYVIGVVMVIYIVNRDDNPMYKLAWIIPILILPILGPILYLFVRLDLGSHIFAKVVDDAIEDVGYSLKQDDAVIKELEEIDYRKANLASYVSQFGGYPIYKNSSVKYLSTGEEKFEVLKEELRKAEKFIFLEYFIIGLGRMWGEVEEILFEKAKQGVEVRLMYDGTCSILRLPLSFPQYMEEHGVRCKIFNPVKPLLATYQNTRDHRKIVVIDGHTAFTGGVNLSDEYINEIEMFGHWKDTAVMIKGESVKNFTAMFLQMWNTKLSDDLDPEKYLDVEVEVPENAHGYVLNYSDSPTDGETVGESVYLDMIYKADKYIFISSPYLILDNEMETALTYASKSGVDVRIVVPKIPDKKYVYYLGRNHYQRLIKAGVKLYEYTPGFIHAKMFLCDDIEAVVGTINLDFRSLYLHFECASYIYANNAVDDIYKDFIDIFAVSELITEETISNYNIFTVFLGKILKVFAPLM